MSSDIVVRRDGELAADRALKVLVVRGVDASAFAPAAARAFQETYAAAMGALAGFPKPSVAMIQGPCVDAGCTIAAACDLRLADRSARFAITPARLGHRATKQIVAMIASGHATETEASRALFLEAIHGEDYQEGVRAFREKRKPRFTFL